MKLPDGSDEQIAAMLKRVRSQPAYYVNRTVFDMNEVNARITFGEVTIGPIDIEQGVSFADAFEPRTTIVIPLSDLRSLIETLGTMLEKVSTSTDSDLE